MQDVPDSATQGALGIVAGIIIAIATKASVAWAKTRVFSGKVDTSPSGQLWQQWEKLVREHREQNDHQQTQIARLEARLEEKEARIERLAERIEVQDVYMRECDEKNAQLTAKLANVERTVEQLKADLHKVGGM